MVMQKRMVFLKIGVWLTAVFLLMSASSKAAAGEQSIVDILNANSGNGTGGQSGVPESAAVLPDGGIQENGGQEVLSVQGSEDAVLTLMVYMCGSDLESICGSAARDLSEMALSGCDSGKVNVVVMTGGAQKWHYPGVADHAVGIHVLKGGSFLPASQSETVPSMGDPDTLKDFIDFSYENYPAKRYALLFWDHGGGSLGGVCHDELWQGDCLQMEEMVSALEQGLSGREKLEWIGFDACLMASAETAEMMAPFASYMIASEESEVEEGWNYAFLKGIENDVSGAETGKRIIDLYFEALSGLGAGLTLTCVDLSQMDRIAACTEAFFGTVNESWNEQSFSQAARARRLSRAFGRDEQTSVNDFDLVDLGDLVKNYAGGSASADALQDALAAAISYSASNISGCTGLSVYHPYYNKLLYPNRKTAYENLKLSEAYETYITKFAECLLTGTGNEWNDLHTSLGKIDRDVRTILTLTLTEEQALEAVDADMIALQKNEEGSYCLAARQGAELYEDHAVSGEYVHTNLFVTDGEGSPVWDRPLLYDEKEDGTYQVQVKLAKAGEEPVSARLICSPDEAGNSLSVRMVWLQDELTGTYSSRMTASLDEYDSVIFSQTSRAETKDESGALLPFDEWDIVSDEEYGCPSDSVWKLSFVRDYLDTESLIAAFEITDIFNGVHMSSMIPITSAPRDNAGMVLTYDDMSLLLLNAESMRLTALPDGSSLGLSGQITNISDREVIIEIKNVRVNQTELSAETAVYGTGDSEGLLPDEAQPLMLFLKTDEMDGIDQISEIEFDMRAVDGSGQEIGVIPVKIQTNYDRNFGAETVRR